MSDATLVALIIELCDSVRSPISVLPLPFVHIIDPTMTLVVYDLRLGHEKSVSGFIFANTRHFLRR